MREGVSDQPTGIKVVLVTVPDPDQGLRLARRIVKERLAACANVIPEVSSVYRWDGAIQEDAEVLVLFKTTDTALEALKERVLELHGYEVPEFVALSVVGGYEPYLRWVVGEVMNPQGVE